LAYVEKVCEKYKVPLEIIPLQKEYWQRVVKEAIEEVKAGRTPNPDMLCNERIKFGVFYDYVGKNFDKIASGHYAQVEAKDGQYYLKRAPDAIKDQTYFLAKLSQKQLARVMFPIGHLAKSEVRALAGKFDLPNKDRKDSQGICFLGKIKYRDWLREHLGEKQGDILNKKTGEKMGEHDGFWYYTIGQRKDIKLSGGPWYVIDKDIDKNVIYIGLQDEVEVESKNEFLVEDMNWIPEKPSFAPSYAEATAGKKATEGKNLKVKIRHGEKFYNCKVGYLEEGRLKIKMDKGDQGLAAGQYAVLYDGQYCLGGGKIII